MKSNLLKKYYISTTNIHTYNNNLHKKVTKQKNKGWTEIASKDLPIIYINVIYNQYRTSIYLTNKTMVLVSSNH